MSAARAPARRGGEVWAGGGGGGGGVGVLGGGGVGWGFFSLFPRGRGGGAPAITRKCLSVSVACSYVRRVSTGGSHVDQEAEPLPEPQRYSRQGHQALRDRAGREGR